MLCFLAYSEQMIMKITPRVRPGMMPPANIRATDMPVMAAKTIMSQLGGMMGPREPAPPIRAPTKPFL